MDDPGKALWRMRLVISVHQVSRDQNYWRGRSRNGGKGTDVGRNCQGSEAKSKVIGEQRQEVFSGSSEKSGSKEASQDSSRGVGGTSKFLQLVQGTAGSVRGLKKVVPWSSLLWLWPKLFGCKVMVWEAFRIKRFDPNLLLISHLILSRFLDPYFPSL